MKKNSFFVILSWVWLLMIFIASLVPNPKSFVRQIIKKLLRILGRPDVDKNIHFLFYFSLVFLFVMAYKDNKIRAFLFFGAIGMSGIIEIIQPRLTHGRRKFDIHDLMYNIAGCVSALILALILEYLINSFSKKRMYHIN